MEREFYISLDYFIIKEILLKEKLKEVENYIGKVHYLTAMSECLKIINLMAMAATPINNLVLKENGKMVNQRKDI